MGGQLQRREPVEHSVLLYDVEVVRRFNACGWLGYFLELTEFDKEIATEFIHTFEEGEATVWGLTIVATEEWIAEVTGLLIAGEHYLDEHNAKSATTQFSLPGDTPLEITKQGYKRMSIPPPYNELTMYVLSSILLIKEGFLICSTSF